MQPASPMELSAMCEGRGAHWRSWKQRAPRNKYNKINNNIACVICRQRWCMVAAVCCSWWRQSSHRNKQSRNTKLRNQCNQSPLPHNHIQLKTTTQNHKQKQPSQQTPCSIKQTYGRGSVFPNEKDGPKMTTAQCNRRRRWSSLQCVRDGERTKDHENSTRHATNKMKSTAILHASYAGSDGAWWRRCAAYNEDEGCIATNKREIQ